MVVAIILGNRLHDDGSITELMLKRLELTLQLNDKLNPDKIILSGGVANPFAGKSEAEAMRDWLVARGLSEDKLVLEQKSKTTNQNARYSVPLALKLGATEIVLCSSQEHINRPFLNPVTLFLARLEKHPDIKLSVFCD